MGGYEFEYYTGSVYSDLELVDLNRMITVDSSTKVDMPLILDACCGSRMFWFDKENPNCLFIDKRSETVEAKDRSYICAGTTKVLTATL